MLVLILCPPKLTKKNERMDGRSCSDENGEPLLDPFTNTQD